MRRAARAANSGEGSKSFVAAASRAMRSSNCSVFFIFSPSAKGGSSPDDILFHRTHRAIHQLRDLLDAQAFKLLEHYGGPLPQRQVGQPRRELPESHPGFQLRVVPLDRNRHLVSSFAAPAGAKPVQRTIDDN